MEFLPSAFVYLLAAVCAVPIANRLGLGSVLGYLIAGIVIGPVLGVIGSESEEVKHFAEFGVVMMLFLVGLELQPARLWQMRTRLLGLGGLQVAGTILLLAGVALAFGFRWQEALSLGMILSLSSTAIVLQTLNEKGWMRSEGGQSSFSVLLFQDIAVIPMLALLPLLATASGGGESGHGHGGALDHMPGWAQTLVLLGVITAIVLAGRYLVRPVFRFIAEARLREIFTAAALLLVIGTALAMEQVGLSPALGTFLAGVVLSDSEYRHELESDIDPFKGLLLGLFFISVGAGIDFDLLFGQPGLILGLAAGLMTLKFLVLLPLGLLFGLRGAPLWLFALSLAQAGEFAFVLFGYAGSNGVLPPGITQQLTLVVALSMLLTPLLFIVYEKFIAPRKSRGPASPADAIDEKGKVIVCGMGRFGLVVSRMLVGNGYRVVVLDHDPRLIEHLRRMGIQTWYGDANRPDLLHSAGIEEADLLVAALDDPEKQLQLVEHVKRHHPDVGIIARAHDHFQRYELEKAGACHVIQEITESALDAGRQALVRLGMHPFKAERQKKAFRRYLQHTVDSLRESWNREGIGKNYLDVARARVQELDEVMRSDRAAERHDASERGWVPPPMGNKGVYPATGGNRSSGEGAGDPS